MKSLVLFEDEYALLSTLQAVMYEDILNILNYKDENIGFKADTEYCLKVGIQMITTFILMLDIKSFRSTDLVFI